MPMRDLMGSTREGAGARSRMPGRSHDYAHRSRAPLKTEASARARPPVTRSDVFERDSPCGLARERRRAPAEHPLFVEERAMPCAADAPSCLMEHRAQIAERSKNLVPHRTTSSAAIPALALREDTGVR